MSKIIPFVNRRIEVVDGESIEGTYFFLACSNGAEIENEKGLSSKECFEFLSSCEEKGKNILTIFGINYDVQNWLASFPRLYLESFYNSTGFKPVKMRASDETYFLSYLKGKKFSCKKKLGKSFTVWETFTFFQESFVKVLEKNLPSAKKYLEEIRKMKEKRSQFSWNEKELIKKYCRKEVLFHREVMESFFDKLRNLEVELKNLFSPASIAKHYFVKHDVKRGLEERNFQELNNSYYGGRFELIRFGKSENKIYEYDINSAYPFAMTSLGSAKGEWRKEKRIKDEFSLIELTWRFPKELPFFPFPFRTNGTIIFPSIGRSFVRGVEYFSGKKFQNKFGGKIKINNIWNFYPRENRKIFHYINYLYDERKEYKRQGNGAEKILKLVINSSYGATAQLHPVKGKWFQMEWASWITAKTRSMVLEAALLAPESIISFATDSVLSTRKLPLPISEKLGEWSEEVYEGIIIVQSGLYFMKKENEWKIRTRGFSSREISKEIIEEAWKNKERKIKIKCVRFASLSKGVIEGKWNEWRKWVMIEKEIDVLGNSEKRINIARQFPKKSLIFLHPVSNFESEYQIFQENERNDESQVEIEELDGVLL